MVAEQLLARGITDRRVLEAVGSVPREEFVPRSSVGDAYADRALAIDCGQTISQPWIVAAICQGLELGGAETVLEIGTGTGYSTAVLARLAAKVVSVERIETLAGAARKRLNALGLSEPVVEVRVGDGSVGLPERAPYEAIAVHAAVPRAPAALLDQLATGGRLVAPVAAGDGEILSRYRRASAGARDQITRQDLALCRFVPLIGAQGYPAPRAGSG